MINWFKNEFAQREMLEAKYRNILPEELLNERLSEVPPGSNGLILQPFWGPGLKTPDAKGAIIGFGDKHTRSHMYRAVIEGINYSLMDGMEKIEMKSRIKINRVMVSGGGSRSDAICQITADMFNRPVFKGRTYEASGLGAAINGFVGLGINKSYEEAIKHMVHYTKTSSLETVLLPSKGDRSRAGSVKCRYKQTKGGIMMPKKLLILHLNGAQKHHPRVLTDPL